MKTYKITIQFDESLRNKKKEEQLAKVVEGAIALAHFPDVVVELQTPVWENPLTKQSEV